MLGPLLSTILSTAAVNADTTVVSAQQRIVIIIDGSPPPPPPLDTVVPMWAPLYFFLGLCGFYILVMTMVIGSFYVKTMSPAEAQPLQKNVETAFQRPTSRSGKFAWEGASPEMRQQYAIIDGWVRAAFIRKVYAILCTQLLATVGIVVLAIYCCFVQGDPHYPTDVLYYLTGPGYYIILLLLLVSMCTLCGIFSCKNQYPANMIGLAIFTTFMSIVVADICVIYCERARARTGASKRERESASVCL